MAAKVTAAVSRDTTFSVDGLSIAARLHGEGGLPAIALHGWLDNAASFEALGQRLAGEVQLLAPDLSGHGLSEHKPASGSYAIWDDLRSIVAIADQMGWSRFALIGHSRGAMMSTLLAASLPERISHLVCIDGLVSEGVPDADVGKQMGKYLRDYGSEPSKPASYASLDEAIAARCRAMPMNRDAARSIVERGTLKGEDGRYRWRSDRRLPMASPVKFTDAQWRALVEGVACPALVVLAEQGFGGRLASILEGYHHTLSTLSLAGGHHLHMDEGADAISEAIRAFLRH